MNMKEFKSILHKVWYFIWESDSIWSWIINIILAFIIIKFLVYPGLGFALGTSHPIVAVVSGSMEHDGSFDQWWQSSASCDLRACTQSEFYSEFDIIKEQFRDIKTGCIDNIGYSEKNVFYRNKSFYPISLYSEKPILVNLSIRRYKMQET